MDTLAADLSLAEFRIELAAKVKELTPTTDLDDSRGVVILCDSVGSFVHAWIAIRIIRDFNPELPIELCRVSQGRFAWEFSDLLEGLGVMVRDVSEMGAVDDGSPRRARIRALLRAICGSSFTKILYLDAHTIPLRDPASLFDGEHFLTAGSVFWPAPCQGDSRRLFWEIVSEPSRTEVEFDTSVMLIDRAATHHALELAEWLLDRDVLDGKRWGDAASAVRLAWRIFACQRRCRWSVPN